MLQTWNEANNENKMHASVKKKNQNPTKNPTKTQSENVYEKLIYNVKLV